MALPTGSCPFSVLPVVDYILRPRLSCLLLCGKNKGLFVGQVHLSFRNILQRSIFAYRPEEPCQGQTLGMKYGVPPLACYMLISMKDEETCGNVPGVLKRAGMRWYH